MAYEYNTNETPSGSKVEEDTDAPIKIETTGDVEVEKKTKSEPKKSSTKKSTPHKKKSKSKGHGITKGKLSSSASDSLSFVPHPERGGHTVGQLMQMQQHERVAILGEKENRDFEKKYM